MSDQPVPWTPPEPPTPEKLRNKAHTILARIDRDREIVRLIGEGLTDEEIAKQVGCREGRAKSMRNHLANGEEVRPLDPYELGLRRCVGQLSTEDMMNQLRTWPYTFGEHHFDFYDGGTWDDIGRLNMFGFMTDEEYSELRAIAEQLPGWRP